MEKVHLIKAVPALKKSWEIVKQNKRYIFRILLTIFILLLPIIIANMVLEYIYAPKDTIVNTYYEQESNLPPLVSIPLGLIGYVYQIFATSFVFLGFIKLYNSEKPGIKELAKESLSNLWKFALLNILVGLIVSAGFLLFIVPGVILGLTYYASTYIFLEKKLGIIESLKESKKLTSDYKGQLFLTTLGIGLLSIFIIIFPAGVVTLLAFALGTIGQVLSIVIIVLSIPIYIVFILLYYATIFLVPVVLYKDLEKIKNEENTASEQIPTAPNTSSTTPAPVQIKPELQS